MIPKEKKDTLQKWGVSGDILDSLEALDSEEANLAAEAGLESKEVDQQEEVEVEESEIKKEVAEALTIIVKALTSKMEEGFSDIEQRMKDFDASVDEKVDSALSNYTSASLAGMLSKQLSVKESDKTAVDGRTELAKKKPEAPEGVEKEVPVRTGIPVIDKMLSGGSNER